jgi:acyl-CoA synthetase (NDP forming)
MSALQSLLSAQSIAVIGASNHHEKVGNQVFRNLILGAERAHAKRKLYPINPTSKSVLNHPAFPSITAVKDPVDLVIIVTPAPTVPPIIDEIIERNRPLAKKDRIKAVCIITAGFAETDKKGSEIQHVIATKLQLAGIHLLGPNTLGFIYPKTGLNASFAQNNIPDGNLALISQSGAMLVAIFDAIEHQQIGVSFAVSLGNKADLSENDCLEYALKDPDTDVVVIYVESFTCLPRFFELTSQISKKKPVIVLKGGTSQRGQQASASHTAALATNQVLLDAASEQMGFTLVNTIEELLNVAFFLSRHRHLPENTMVITNAGGPAVNTIDTLEKNGVKIAQWSKHSLQNLEVALPMIHPANPLDLLGDASPERFRAALQIAQRDVDVESIILIATPQAVTDMPGIVREVIEQKGKKPILVSLVGGEHLEKLRQELRDAGVTTTDFPNDLSSLLRITGQLAQHKYKTEQFYSSEPHCPKFPDQIFPENALKRTPQTDIDQAFKLLQTEGFEVPKYQVVTQHNLDEQLEKMKYPMFAKTGNLTLLHKKKIGAIYGRVTDEAEARKAYTAMQPFGNQVLFQELIEIETELLLGVENDPQFGLYMTIGMGGSYTNIMADRSYVFLPAHKPEIEAAWEKTKAYQVFAKQTDTSKAIVKQMLQLQKLIMKNPWIRSLEINPLVVNYYGVFATDIKVQVK